MSKRTGRPRGRPKGTYKQLDLYKLQALALIGVPVNKIAILLGISVDTLDNRFRSEIEAARTEGERQLLHTAFKLAIEGDTKILLACLTNRCGWSARPEIGISVVQNAVALPITDQTKEKLFELHQMIRREALLGTSNEANGNGDQNGMGSG